MVDCALASVGLTHTLGNILERVSTLAGTLTAGLWMDLCWIYVGIQWVTIRLQLCLAVSEELCNHTYSGFSFSEINSHSRQYIANRVNFSRHIDSWAMDGSLFTIWQSYYFHKSALVPMHLDQLTRW